MNLKKSKTKEDISKYAPFFHSATPNARFSVVALCLVPLKLALLLVLLTVSVLVAMATKSRVAALRLAAAIRATLGGKSVIRLVEPSQVAKQNQNHLRRRVYNKSQYSNKTTKLPNRGITVVANHVSLLDPLLLIELCAPAFVAKSGVQKVPFIGRIASAFGAIYVDK